VASCLFASVEEGCDICVKEKGKTEAEDDRHSEYMKFYGLYTKLYPALKDSFKELSSL